MKTVLVPWEHVDVLSYGDSYHMAHAFIAWLRTAPEVVFIPRGKNLMEHFCLTLATKSIKDIAASRGITVLKARR